MLTEEIANSLFGADGKQLNPIRFSNGRIFYPEPVTMCGHSFLIDYSQFPVGLLIHPAKNDVIDVLIAE